MSACISMHGEYSEHEHARTGADRFVCSRCGVLAEDALLDALDGVEHTHRDLVSRLGFGNNITEPMADNDTIVAWFEEQSRDANEWQESQLWRADCYAKGHADDDDCFECDPRLRLERAEAELQRLRERIEQVSAAYLKSWQRHAGASTLDTDVAQMLRNLLVRKATS